MSYTKKYTFAPLPSTTRGQSIKLDADPKGKSFIYTNGKSVFIRDLENPTIATEYVGHRGNTTVARYSPSGYYIASGDSTGNVRIWDTVNEDHILKNETRPLSGKITDIAWDSESKRIIAVGEGKERFGHAFSFDTSSSVGEIIGHSKIINSVSIRQQRPFRAVTASDDMTVSFFNGVPFKYAKSINDHTRFVHSVQFSPSGDFFASAGADGKLFLYDGKTGDHLAELSTAENTHQGGIFSISWSPDSTQILSSSADCTAKIWDINTKSVTSTFSIDSSCETIDNQQVGNLWKGNHLITASLSGELNYLDQKSGQISRHVNGHSKAITAISVSKEDTFFTGSYDGRACAWKYGESGEQTMAEPVEGPGHGNQITSLSIHDNKFVSTGMDDTLRAGLVNECQFSGTSVTTASLPKSVAVSDKIIAVATNAGIEVYNDQLKKLSVNNGLGVTPSTIAVDKDGLIYVGGEDKLVRIYQLEEDRLVQKGELKDNMGNITSLAIHPQLNLIAVGDSLGKIFVYDTETRTPVIRNWVYHTSRITSLDWSPCGQYLVSGSIDTHIYIWNRETPSKKIAIKNAHVDAVNSVRFLHKSELGIVSVGQDAAVRVWAIHT
ncbi:WD40-repeat-containing domain protein [Pilobolus umbonatus]|nr:WD40-repeat-containing domain protein [Pilobolus umbonatus]